LNLTADAELARPSAVTPSRAVLARCEALAARLGGLVPDGDLRYGEGTAPVGVAWCPTPDAVRRLREAGAVVAQAPSLATLRAANARAFAASLMQALPGAAYVRDEASLVACVAHGSLTGRWLLKRAYGFSGTGRLRVRGTTLDDSALRWAQATLAMGDGLQVEPEVDRVEDYGLHGYLARDGVLTRGALTRQHIDAHGQWRATERCSHAITALDEVIERVAVALRALGYWGPFGIDAYRWRDPQGVLHLNPLCEVNARYSMGWATGMHTQRPDLVDHAENGK
jgi:hypothetical protein